MTEQELQQYIRQRYPEENARCEWKEMKNLKNSFNGKEGNDVLSYVSAIANMEGGELVIGVKDQTLDIVGTDLSALTFNGFAATPLTATFKLVEQCVNLSSEGLRVEEFITEDTQKTVWIIHIPKHQPRRPVYAHRKAWQRIADSLVEMTQERMQRILSEPSAVFGDWTANIIEDATIDDLDPDAIRMAREKYTERHEIRAKEIESWDDATFLNKAKITRAGKITNAAIILLGREESEHFLSPAVCVIRWKLLAKEDKNKDFHNFHVPMIKSVEEITTGYIRNNNYVYTVSGNIFPENMMRYDVFTLREPICNAIGHQDYGMGARIELLEYEDEKLVIQNYGQFIPNSVEDVVEKDCPDSRYRNPFLMEAMCNIGMAETEGGGIRKLFVQQRKRFFPMPIYDSVFSSHRFVGFFVYFGSEKLQSLADSLPLQPSILTYTARKQDGIYSAHCSGVRSYVFLDAVCEHIECKGFSLLAFFLSGDYISHIDNASRYSVQTAFLIDEVIHLFAVHVLLFGYVQKHSQIQISAS